MSLNQPYEYDVRHSRETDRAWLQKATFRRKNVVTSLLIFNRHRWPGMGDGKVRRDKIVRTGSWTQTKIRKNTLAINFLSVRHYS